MNRRYQGFRNKIFLLVFLAGHVCFAQHLWSMFQHDPQHTGRSEYSGPASPEEKWHFDISTTEGLSSPAIASDGTVYVGSMGGQCLHAINPDGSEKWTFDCSFISSSPCIDLAGTIYFGAGMSLYAVYPNGTEKWQYPTGGPIIRSSPVFVSDGVIYIGSCDSCLYSINSDGTFNWKYPTNGMIVSSPAIAHDGTIYIGSCDGKLYAINSDGTLHWDYNTGGEIYSSPAINDSGIIYFGSLDSYLYALNPEGSLKWRVLCGAPVESSPTIGSDGTIYIGADDGYLYAVSPDDSIKWQFRVGDYEVYASPIVGANGTIYIGSHLSSILYALNPDGTEKWQFIPLSGLYSSFALDDDNSIYFQTSSPAYLQVVCEESKMGENRSNSMEFECLEIIPSIYSNQVEIVLDIPSKKHLRLDIYDNTGRQVESILNRVVNQGHYKFIWSVPISNGTYFVILRNNGRILAKKLIKIG